MSSSGRRPSWPSWIMVLGAATMLTHACACGPTAFASGTWVHPVRGPVLLGYGEAYLAPGGSGSRAHSGVDLGCGEGDSALSCEGGTVSFAGAVPSDAGGRILAVTIAGDDGLRITYMPLATATVAAGQRIEAGSTVGGIAGVGDASSAVPHLHMSVRRGEAYLDPAGMLASAGGSGAGGGSSAVKPPVAASQPAVAPAPSPAAPARVSAQSAVPAASAAAAVASLPSLRAASPVSPEAALRAVNGRVSLLSPMPVSAGRLVPVPHATGLTAFTASWSSASRALTIACAGLAVGLGGLACTWRSLRTAAGNAASITMASALEPAANTARRRA